MTATGNFKAANGEFRVYRMGKMQYQVRHHDFVLAVTENLSSAMSKATHFYNWKRNHPDMFRDWLKEIGFAT